MIKKSINLVSSIIFALSISYTGTCFGVKTFFNFQIDFPETMASIPDVRVYNNGFKIKSEQTSHGLSFSIPEDKNRRKFNLIVTETVQFHAEQDTNTIQYLKIASQQKYKFYSLIKNDDQWHTEEQVLSLANGRIPDDAIIICFNPAYVDHLEGGNALELPKVVLKKDMVKLAGSEARLHDASVTSIIAALDTDAIHANTRQEIKNDYKKTRIIMVSA